LRAKAQESLSDITWALFSSAFGHFRFNRNALCGVRGRNAAKQRRHSLRRGSGSRARVAGLIAMVSARRLEDQRLHEDEDVFGIAAARVGKFLHLIQTKRMG
jgi:hypothetical protein